MKHRGHHHRRLIIIRELDSGGMHCQPIQVPPQRKTRRQKLEQLWLLLLYSAQRKLLVDSRMILLPGNNCGLYTSANRNTLDTKPSLLPDMDFEGAELTVPIAAAETSAGSSVGERVRRALAKYHEEKARQVPAAMRRQDSPVRATFTPGPAEPRRRSRAVSIMTGIPWDSTVDFPMNASGGVV